MMTKNVFLQRDLTYLELARGTKTVWKLHLHWPQYTAQKLQFLMKYISGYNLSLWFCQFKDDITCQLFIWCWIFCYCCIRDEFKHSKIAGFLRSSQILMPKMNGVTISIDSEPPKISARHSVASVKPSTAARKTGSSHDLDSHHLPAVKIRPSPPCFSTAKSTNKVQVIIQPGDEINYQCDQMWRFWAS